MNSNDGIVSLVNFLGDEKIKFQVVHNSLDGEISTDNGETRFTMITESENLSPTDVVNGKYKKLGLVLWIDTDDYMNWRDN